MGKELASKEQVAAVELLAGVPLLNLTKWELREIEEEVRRVLSKLKGK